MSRSALSLVYGALSCLHFIFHHSSEGRISLPPGGKTLTLFPGSNARIEWSLSGATAFGDTRFWTFISRNGSINVIARIVDDHRPEIFAKHLLKIEIEKPATLVLNNVNDSYNGVYRFEFWPRVGSVGRSDVTVFIAKKPTVTFSCLNTTTLNEGDDFSCLCKGEDGNPPANVTWFKNDKKRIGKTGKKEQLLTFSRVDNADSGTYKCLAESYPDENYKDEDRIRIIVNFRPRKINISFSQGKAKVGEAINITCESVGRPEPSFTITHNNTKVIADKTYNIPQVKWSDGGSYQCTAKNKLGSNSKCYCLTVSGKATSSKKVTRDMGDAVVVWHIVVSLISGIVIGCLLSYIVSCSRRKIRIRSRKPQQSNPEPPKSQVDKTYQELDLTKMNTEDHNYQSLKVNQPAKNDNGNKDDSTYTELSQTREAENSYQSLT